MSSKLLTELGQTVNNYFFAVQTCLKRPKWTLSRHSGAWLPGCHALWPCPGTVHGPLGVCAIDLPLFYVCALIRNGLGSITFQGWVTWSCSLALYPTYTLSFTLTHVYTLSHPDVLTGTEIWKQVFELIHILLSRWNRSVGDEKNIFITIYTHQRTSCWWTPLYLLDPL